MSVLLRVGAISEEDIGAYVRRHATVIEQFDHLTQDSGNVSRLVDVGDRRLFVKATGAQSGGTHGGPVPYFDHVGRVELLRNAVELSQSCSHAALPRLCNVIETPSGPALVYEAAAGELVGVPPDMRDDPGLCLPALRASSGREAPRPVRCPHRSSCGPRGRRLGWFAICTTGA